MIRKLCLCLALLTLGCRAQGPAPADADVNRRVERHVRTMLQAPEYVKINVTGRKPSTDFVGYDQITVALSAGDKEKTFDFVISKDNKTLISVSKVDLTVDPYEANMKKIDIAGRPVRGNKDAKVTVVVYDDYQCPYCSRLHQTVLESLKTYGNRVKFVYKDFPLDFHPWAMRAAINSQCLAEQSSDAYWAFTDYVHANPTAISGERGSSTPLPAQFKALDKAAEDAGKKFGVDASKLNACIMQQQRKDKVDASMAEAQGLGIDGTPAFFINGQKGNGAVPVEQFNAMLDRALADAGDATAKGAGSQ
jgi:protein-disulfide isomerase